MIMNTPAKVVSAGVFMMKLHEYDAEARHKLNASSKVENTADVLSELALRLPD